MKAQSVWSWCDLIAVRARVLQLTPEERAAYDKLAAGSDDARRFLFARGFLRYCQLVAEKKMEPWQLPALPRRSDWDGKKFFSEKEYELVEYAIGLKLLAKMKPNLPISPELRLLSVDELNPDERKEYAKLPANSDAARQFLHTRSFLRPCQKVIDRALDPLKLPPLPRREDWDRKFLSETESKQTLDVCLMMKIMARMK